MDEPTWWEKLRGNLQYAARAMREGLNVRFVKNFWDGSLKDIPRWYKWDWAKPLDVWGIVHRTPDKYGEGLTEVRAKLGPIAWTIGLVRFHQKEPRA